MNCQISMCSTTDTGFTCTKLLSRFQAQFLHICRNMPYKNFLKCMLQFGIVPNSEFLYVITNHATDAIKAVIHTVNMKFRKLKKNNVRNRERPMCTSNIRISAHWHPLTTSVNQYLRSADTDSKKKLWTVLRKAESTCDCCKNLAIANRSCISGAHNTSRASIGLITHDLEI